MENAGFDNRGQVSEISQDESNTYPTRKGLRISVACLTKVFGDVEVAIKSYRGIMSSGIEYSVDISPD